MSAMTSTEPAGPLPGFIAYVRDGDEPAAARHPVTYQVGAEGLVVTAPGADEWVHMGPVPVLPLETAEVRAGLFAADGTLLIWWTAVVRGGEQFGVRTGLIAEIVAG